MQQPPSSAPVSALRRLSSFLHATSPLLVDPVLQRKSRLLATLLLGMTAVFACVDTVFTLTIPDYSPPWYGYLFLAGTYLLNRRGHYSVAAACVVAMFPIVAFAHVIVGDSADPDSTLGYLALSPMLGTILLSMRGVALLSAINVVGIALMPLLSPSLQGFGEVVGALSASTIAAILALVYMYHRNQVEADRQALLRESEQRLQLALEAAAMGIWDLHTEDDRLTVTPGFERILGLSPGELGQSLSDFEAFVHPDDRAHVDEAVQAAFREGSDEIAMSYRIVRKDGAVRWLEARGRVIRDGGGNALKSMGTVSDITARRALENQLRQAQKMEAIGRLAGGIAHDFNNLLMVILGNLELMKAQDSRHAEQIRQAAESASALTRRLLAFGRKSILSPRAIELNAALRATGEMLERIIGEDIKVRLELADDLPRVYLDASLIEHVLLNLATNARDAMPDGGTLSITTRSLTRAQGERMVVMEVSDTGCGMDPHTRAHIFEPFFTTKQAGRGTGLGLSMVYGLISQSGGDIEVESSPGRGSTFRLFFPQAPADEQPQPRSRANDGSTWTRRAHILVIEDEPAVREVCCEVLRGAGHRVSSADNGAQARVRLSNAGEPIDLVLCDAVLPDGSGLALMREHAPGQRVLFMSGYAPGRPEGEAPPAEQTLRKPFTGEELLRRVDALLGELSLHNAS